MKTTRIYAFLVAGLLSLPGCSPKEEAAKPAENTLTNFMSSESSLSASVRASGPWELGLVFSASVAGKITQLGAKMPEPGTYRLIIWDFDTKQVIRQKTVEQTAPDKLTLDAIDPLALTPNKKYVISVNSQSGGANKKYGVAYKTAGGDFMPFTKGSILVYNACYRNSATPVFPDAAVNVKYEAYGFPEFTFIAD